MSLKITHATKWGKADHELHYVPNSEKNYVYSYFSRLKTPAKLLRIVRGRITEYFYFLFLLLNFLHFL